MDCQNETVFINHFKSTLVIPPDRTELDLSHVAVSSRLSTDDEVDLCRPRIKIAVAVAVVVNGQNAT